MKKCYSLLLFVGLIFSQLALGQSQQGQLIRIMVSPSKADMIYQKGDNISFDVAVYKFGQLVEGAEIEYEIGPEKMEPVLTGNSTLKKGTTTLKGGKLNVPGFIRCKVTYKENGKTYSNIGTAGIAPLDIQPTTTLPKDFEEFWEEGKKALKDIPLEPVLTLIPERSTHHTNVYHVSFKNISGKIYGILTKPKKPGKYPAILHVPGAGIRPYYGANINQDVIALQIGIHGIFVIQRFRCWCIV